MEQEQKPDQKPFSIVDRSKVNDAYAAHLAAEEKAGLPSETVAVTPSADKDNALTPVPSDSHPSAEKSEAAPVVADVEEVVTDPSVVVKEEPKEIDSNLKRALDEERAKRKEKTLEARREREEKDGLKAQLTDLQARHQAVIDENKRLADGVVPEDGGVAMRLLADENKALRAELAKTQTTAQQSAQEKEQARIQSLIQNTDAGLTKQGYPGFTKFIAQVNDAILKHVNEGDFELKDVTPDVWATVYAKEVYPEMQKLLVKQRTTDKLQEKKALKKDANLVSSPGSHPSNETESKNTPEDYASFRKAKAVR